MAKYEVRVNGAVIWSEKVNSTSSKAFPPEFRGRPEDGEVELLIDGRIVATMRPEHVDRAAVEAQRVEERAARVAAARALLIAEGEL